MSTPQLTPDQLAEIIAEQAAEKKAADIVVLDRDIFACPPHEISDTAVHLTLFKGREVWRDPSFDG